MVRWYGAGTLDNLLRCRSDRVAVMARQLPELMDEHYLALQQVRAGQYRPIAARNKVEAHNAEMSDLDIEARGLLQKLKKLMGR